ncbi:MAG: hypothetical protein II060_12380, partial [Bacteroidales bacterium]|nr:hypothetical protein [Bacteroidales bacterium]
QCPPPPCALPRRTPSDKHRIFPLVAPFPLVGRFFADNGKKEVDVKAKTQLTTLLQVNYIFWTFVFGKRIKENKEE